MGHLQRILMLFLMGLLVALNMSGTAHGAEQMTMRQALHCPGGKIC